MTNSDLQSNTQKNNYLVFFDNIRTLIIFLVITGHSVNPYATVAPWWFVIDTDSSIIFDGYGAILDCFCMAVMFFIAGYFLLYSLRKNNLSSSILTKIKRLGIPWFFCVFFFVPMMPYIRYNLRNPVSKGFWEFWSVYVNFTDPNSKFDQYHLWFISLLLFFFIVSAIVYKVITKFSKISPQSENSEDDPDNKSMFSTFVIAGLFMSLCVSITNFYYPDDKWVHILNLLEFQPTRLPLYIGFFILGIYGGNKKWFAKPLPGTPLSWYALCVISSLIFLPTVKYLYETKEVIPWLIILHGLSRTALNIFSLFFLISFSYKYWNKPTKLGQNLSSISYDFYLIHMPIVVVFQLIMLYFNFSIFIKYGIVLLMSTLVSYGISNFLIGRSRKLTVVLLLILFAIAIAFLSPGS